MPKIKINPRVRINNLSSMLNASNNIIGTEAPTAPSASQFGEAMKDLRDMGFSSMINMDKTFALTAYTSIYDKMSNLQKTIISEVDKASRFYLIEVIKNTITDDVLSPSINDDELIRFSSPNPKIEKELNRLKEEINLDQIIEDITPELIAYGEYVLSTKVDVDREEEDVLNLDKNHNFKNETGEKKPKKKTKKFTVKSKGLTQLNDDVDQGTVISLQNNGVVEGYLVENRFTKRKELRHVADYVKFTLGGQRVKVETDKALPFGARLNPELKKLAEKLPRFIRVGKSMIYPFLSKFKELELIEQLAPASKLNQIARGNLVGMSLPENYDLEQAQRVVKKVEASINKKISVDPTSGEITVAKILSSAGKTRIIPLMGDKGTLQNLDYKSDGPDTLTSDAVELRTLVLDSVGVPSEIVYRSEGDSKAELLKRNDKYVRKCRKVQKALSGGCKQVAFIHLENRGIKFKESDVNVIFNNTLIGIGAIEKAEQAEVTVSFLNTIKDFFIDLAEEDSPFKGNVELTKVVDYFESTLQTVGLADAIKTEEEGGKTDKDAVGYGDSKNITDDDLEQEEPEQEER